MKALCWMGTSKVEVHNVPDPPILNPHDAVIKITRTAICGSDLHLFDGFIPTMEEGDILGHEFMGVVEEVGRHLRLLAATASSVRKRFGLHVTTPIPTLT
jgi:threonine dehydrogenase-like Zn-dependent dehydrogenase